MMQAEQAEGGAEHQQQNDGQAIDGDDEMEVNFHESCLFFFMTIYKYYVTVANQQFNLIIVNVCFCLDCCQLSKP